MVPVLVGVTGGLLPTPMAEVLVVVSIELSSVMSEISRLIGNVRKLLRLLSILKPFSRFMLALKFRPALYCGLRRDVSGE